VYVCERVGVYVCVCVCVCVCVRGKELLLKTDCGILDMTHQYVGHDSSICGTWSIYILVTCLIRDW